MIVYVMIVFIVVDKVDLSQSQNVNIQTKKRLNI